MLHFFADLPCSGRVIDGSLGLKTCTCGQQKMYWSEHATIKDSINSGGMWGRSSTSFRLGAAAQELKWSQKPKKSWLMWGDNERGKQEGTEARNPASLFWIQYKKCTPFSWVFACTSAPPIVLILLYFTPFLGNSDPVKIYPQFPGCCNGCKGHFSQHLGEQESFFPLHKDTTKMKAWMFVRLYFLMSYRSFCSHFFSVHKTPPVLVDEF